MFQTAAGLLATTALGLSGLTALAPTSVEAAPAAVVTKASSTSPNDPLYLANRVNALRAERGACPVALVGDLQAAAIDWTEHLADVNKLEHRQLAGAMLAENVGRAANGDRVQDRFTVSPAHLDNMVDNHYNEAGIGVVQSGSNVFVTYTFRSTDGRPHTC